MTKEQAYNHGLDAGLSGATTTNSRFAIFSTPENTAAWEEGKAEGLRQKRGTPKSMKDASPQEREIIALIAAGKKSKEIAKARNLSPITVETYRVKMLRKYGVVNTPHLVALAFQNGILTVNQNPS